MNINNLLVKELKLGLCYEVCDRDGLHICHLNRSNESASFVVRLLNDNIPAPVLGKVAVIAQRLEAGQFERTLGDNATMVNFLSSPAKGLAGWAMEGLV